MNKMDRPGADYIRSMESLTKRLHGNPVPVCVPTEDELILDLVNQVAWKFSGERGEEVSQIPIPPEHQDIFDEHRESMLLAAAEEDESLEEAVLEEADIDPEDIWSALRKGCMAGHFQPVFGGSALRNWAFNPSWRGSSSCCPTHCNVQQHWPNV